MKKKGQGKGSEAGGTMEGIEYLDDNDSQKSRELEQSCERKSLINT